MHRFFLHDAELKVGEPVDITAIAHQLLNVLRLESGARINLLDGTGFAYETEITHLARSQSQGHVLNKTIVISEPWTHLTLYQCSLKADKFEWVLQKGTELGISCFVPVISERSIVRPASAIEKKYERWQRIIQEAAEQCGRGRIPALVPPQSFENALSHAKGLKMLPWENAAIAPAELTHSPQRLDALLAGQETTEEPATQLSLLIGPEGGLSEGEAELAYAKGWQITSLGPRILRAETAAIASTAIIMHSLG